MGTASSFIPSMAKAYALGDYDDTPGDGDDPSATRDDTRATRDDPVRDTPDALRQPRNSPPLAGDT